MPFIGWSRFGVFNLRRMSEKIAVMIMLKTYGDSGHPCLMLCHFFLLLLLLDCFRIFHFTDVFPSMEIGKP